FYLEETAFKTMQTSNLIFKPISVNLPNIPKTPFLEEVFSLGFTKRTKNCPNRFQEEHYFFHLTVQEFFAARYLARSILGNAPINGKEWKQFAQEHKFNNRFSIVLRFTA